MNSKEVYNNSDYVRLYDWSYNRCVEDIGFYRTIVGSDALRVLELGCGTGRITVPLARMGCNVTGVDISEHMLERAAERIGGEPSDVRSRVSFVCDDMISCRLESLFDLVCMPYSTMFHVHPQQRASSFRTMARHCTDGGRIVLDMVHPLRMAQFEPGYKEHIHSGYDPVTGAYVSEYFTVNSADVSERILSVQHTFTEREDSETSVYEFVHVYYWMDVGTCCELFFESGVRDMSVFGSYDFEELTDKSERCIFIGIM